MKHKKLKYKDLRYIAYLCAGVAALVLVAVSISSAEHGNLAFSKISPSGQGACISGCVVFAPPTILSNYFNPNTQNPGYIPVGGATTLTFSVMDQGNNGDDGGTACNSSAGLPNTSLTPGVTHAVGSWTSPSLSPSQTSSYSISCWPNGAANLVSTVNITLWVGPPAVSLSATSPTAPSILNFSSGNATGNCTLTNPDGSTQSGYQANTSYSGNVGETGTYTYTCSNIGASATAQVTLAPAGPPTVSLDAGAGAGQPIYIAPGENITLTGNSTNATSCTLQQPSSSGSEPPGPWSGGTGQGVGFYTLTCNNSSGSASATVHVIALVAPTMSASCIDSSHVQLSWNTGIAGADGYFPRADDPAGACLNDINVVSGPANIGCNGSGYEYLGGAAPGSNSYSSAELLVTPGTHYNAWVYDYNNLSTGAETSNTASFTCGSANPPTVSLTATAAATNNLTWNDSKLKHVR